jgi:hypothetical protein
MPHAVMKNWAVRVVDPVRGRRDVIDRAVRIRLHTLDELAVALHRARDGIGIVIFEPGIRRESAGASAEQAEENQRPHVLKGKNCSARSEVFLVAPEPFYVSTGR